MFTSLKAIIDTTGNVRLLEHIQLAKPQRAVVTILDENIVDGVTLLSEQALAEDWKRPEEDVAWKQFQIEDSSKYVHQKVIDVFEHSRKGL